MTEEHRLCLIWFARSHYISSKPLPIEFHGLHCKQVNILIRFWVCSLWGLCDFPLFFTLSIVFTYSIAFDTGLYFRFHLKNQNSMEPNILYYTTNIYIGPLEHTQVTERGIWHVNQTTHSETFEQPMSISFFFECVHTRESEVVFSSSSPFLLLPSSS